jgi:hypothetical protein
MLKMNKVERSSNWSLRGKWDIVAVVGQHPLPDTEIPVNGWVDITIATKT